MKFYCNRLCLFYLPCHLLLVLFCLANFLAFQANALGNETDQFALLKFKESISGDPYGIFESWNASLHFCNWFGITCGRQHQRVTSIVLEGQDLFGSISPFIGNLSFLRLVNLQNNSFHGEIPQEVGNLFRLQYFIVTNNTLGGEIPVNLSRCSQLIEIDIRGNNIVGEIPAELGNLWKLQTLYLGTNSLSGVIPASLGNLSLLTTFHVRQNNLVGKLPEEMGRLTSLEMLSIAMNNLSGTIPPSLFNTSSIKSFVCARNLFEGSLPDNMGLTLPNLQIFGIGGNQFSGSIPSSLSNASQLQMFDVNTNNLVGTVPTNLGNLQGLWWLNVGLNNLGNNSANDLMFLPSLKNCSNMILLHFASNNFGGVLSDFMPNLSVQITQLFVGNNHLSGTIPVGLQNLINLITLDMRNNLFTGVIPTYFIRFSKLQALDLGGNRLSGQIPSFIGNLTQLSLIFLRGNNFEGAIPSSIQKWNFLNDLDVSYNFLTGVIPLEYLSSLSVINLNFSLNIFTGKLPAEIGKLKSLNNLDISENNLSGEIPDTIGSCSSLEYLRMQGNSFQGPIPSSLSSLKGLQYLDLSRNNLTGQIPKDLQNLTLLQYLNLSFNHLEGEVPTGGVFGNARSISLTVNDKLCGGILELGLPRCPAAAVKKSSSFHHFKLIIIVICVVLPLLVFAFLVLSYVRKSITKPASSIADMENLARISYTELYEATNGFSIDNLVGYGGFSHVYKGFLDQVGNLVAIKVLNLQLEGASKSVMAEINALRNVRHRNCVKIINYCSSLDYKGNDFKALVMEFMESGSLETWLHPVMDIKILPRNLNFLQRLNIAIDVASALYYLHDLCERPIIHCDLKPSNVLLDENMVAHVSDFGLARILSTSNDLSQSKCSTIGLKGTVGYAAPEYGIGSKASKEGDVYSYGILILEMFSRRRPTDEMFKDGLSLHDFVKAALLQQQLMQIVDPTLLSGEMGDTEVEIQEDNSNEIEEQREGTDPTGNFNQMEENMQKCLASILEVGVDCSTESPKERMSMGDITRKLHLIKDSFLHS